MAGLTFNLGRLSPSIFTDSSLNIGIGAAPSGSYKFEVTGTAVIRNDGAAFQLLSSSTSAQYQKWSNGGGNYFIGISNSGGGGLLGSQNNYSFCLVTESARDMSFGTNSLPRMTIFAGGSVGINTGSNDAGYQLDVNGTGRFSGAYGTGAGLTVSGTTYGTIGANRGASTASAGVNYYSLGSQKWFTGIYENSDNFGFYSVGYAGFPLTLNYSTGAASFSSSVGIGASPASLLYAYSSTNTAEFRLERGGVGDVGARWKRNGSDLGYISNADWIIAGTSSTDFGITAVNNLIFGTASTERLRITSGGNVGIGTSSPLYKTHIANAGANAFIGISNQGASNGDRQLIMGFGGNGSETFATIKGTRYNVADDVNIAILGGNVLIGTTTDNAGKLQVNGEIRMYGSTLFRGMSSNTLQLCGGTSSSNVKIDGSVEVVTIDTNGAERMRIRANGELVSLPTYNNTTSFGASVGMYSDGTFYRSTSSLKYKTDVQDAWYGLNEVMKLNAVTYKSKNERDGDLRFGGLIAEAVDKIGLKEFVVYAEDGTPDALQYGNMVSLLVKAIQESYQIIKDLEARIVTLESK